MKNYELTKRGNIPTTRYMQTGHKVKLPDALKEYCIHIDTTDKDFFDYLDKKLDEIIKKYKDQ